MPGDFLFAGLLVLLLDGKRLPSLDEGGFRALAEMPTLLLNLIEGTPAVVGETAHHADEGEMQAVAALIHRARRRVVGRHGREVRLRPPQAVPLHVRDNLLHHKRPLCLDALDRR